MIQLWQRDDSEISDVAKKCLKPLVTELLDAEDGYPPSDFSALPEAVKQALLADNFDNEPEAVRQLLARAGSEGHILAEEPASSNEEVRDIIEQYTGDTSCSLVVTRVWVRGPFEVLRGGMSLVDLPGEFGANTFRTSVAREYISSSSSPIWVVAAVDQRVHAMMHVRTLIRQLVLDGMIPRCRFILTRADKMGARGQRTIGMMIESGCGLCASPLFEPITT